MLASDSMFNLDCSEDLIFVVDFFRPYDAHQKLENTTDATQ